MRSKSSRVTTVRRKSAYRPRIESLEDRLLMAVITVTSTGDAINADGRAGHAARGDHGGQRHKNIGNVVAVGAYGTDDTIAFDIPGPGVHTIALTSPLPVITDPLTIDGYTQPGSVPNSNPVGQGLNATLLIELVGTGAGTAAAGLNLARARPAARSTGWRLISSAAMAFSLHRTTTRSRATSSGPTPRERRPWAMGRESTSSA